MNKSPFPNTPWVIAITASPRASEPGTYDVTIPKDWSIANLPLGGYLNSLLTNAVRTHFSLHHASLAQPDPITSHCAFISRASFGPGIIRISVSKAGRQYSNVLARLYQSPKGTETLIAEAMITQGNLIRERESGSISLPIANPIPESDIFRRDTGVEMIDPPQFRRYVSAATKIRRIFPPGTTYEGDWSHPVHGPSVRDEWISWHEESGEGVFDALAMAMLVDNMKPPAFNFEGVDVGKNWMATLSITTDVKKAPPPGERGWKWLFLRAVVGKCNFGRYSMDVTLLDEDGDVVAIGRRAEIVLAEERRS
jgi:hypothetical protein